MSNKVRIFSLMLFMIVMIIAIPSDKDDKDIIVPQHKMWDGEEEKEYLDEKGNLVSHLPLVIIKTDGEEIPGENRRDKRKLLVDYSVIDNKGKLNSTKDKAYQTGKALISIRGNSSREFPKKQYLFKTINEGGELVKKEMLDMPAHSAWVLNGSYIDHSQLRNYIAYNISDEIMDYVPRCRMCELLFEGENGEKEYMGIYTIMEKPKVSKERLKLEKYNPMYTKTSYMLQMNSPIEKLNIDHLLISGTLSVDYDLEYPSVREITEESIEYIQNDIYTLEKIIYDAWVNNEWGLAEDKIDIESFVDYYIINEFFQNYDAGRRSTYMYKNIDGKFKMGPVWDFDGAFDNFIDVNMPVSALTLKRQHYYYYFMQDPYFVQKCVKRYKELRTSTLSEEYLIEYIEESGKYIESAAKRNSDKWYEGDTQLFYKDIEKMKDFVINRGRWMDENFEKLVKVIE